MVRLTRVAPDCGAELVAKLEAYNPAGSVKDRIGVAMIDAAEAEGRIEPGTHHDRRGHLGQHGHRAGVRLRGARVRPGAVHASGHEPRARGAAAALRRRGADHRVDGRDERGGGGRPRVSRPTCGDAFIPDQFSNPANPEIHRRTTAEEIWRDMDGKVDVAGGRRGHRRHDHRRRASGSRSATRDLLVVAVEPKSSPVLSGGRPGPHRIQGIGAGFMPPVLDRDVVDEIIAVDDEDAIETARAVRADRGRAGRHVLRRGAVGGDRGGLAPGDARQADGGGHARLGRALREHAVLRTPRDPVAARARALLASAAHGRVGWRQTQQRLKDARAIVVGVGALGSPVATYLAAAGVGHARAWWTATWWSCPTCTASRCT